jgi:hypothetical protein
LRPWTCSAGIHTVIGGPYPASSVGQTCRTATPFHEGETFAKLGLPIEQLVVEFTMPSSGSVHFRGADVRWHHGYRSGTQHVGVGANLTVSASAAG